MSYVDILKHVREKNYSPVMLLYGTEPYFIQKIKQELLKQVIQDNYDNLSVYDLEETPIEEVIDDAESFPFFGDQKLIFADNPTFLTTQPIKLPFEHQYNRLEEYINNPVDYSTIVFIAPYEKLDNRKKITRLINQKATVAECNPIKEYELRKWIKILAKELGVTIAEDAYEIFEAEFIINLHLIQNELRKLAFYIGENGHVTKEIAEQLTSHTVNSSSLILVDAVIEKNLSKAILIYKDLKKMNEEPIGLIALLAFQFRTILQVKLLKLKGYSQYQIGKQLGAHPYVIKIAGNRERLFSIKKLQQIIDQLTKTDAAIKQGRMEQDIAFEMLLYHLIHTD